MASGTPSDDSLPAIGQAAGIGQATGTEPQSASASRGAVPLAAVPGAANPVSLTFDDPQWRQANHVLERRYLDLGRPRSMKCASI